MPEFSIDWRVEFLLYAAEALLGAAGAAAAVAYRQKMARLSPIHVDGALVLRPVGWMRYPFIFLAVGSVLASGFLLLYLSDWKQQHLWMNATIVICSAFATAVIPLCCVMQWRYRVEISEQGVAIEGLFRRQEFGYGEIQRVSVGEDTFDLILHNDKRVKIPKDLMGWSEGIEAIRRGVETSRVRETQAP